MGGGELFHGGCVWDNEAGFEAAELAIGEAGDIGLSEAVLFAEGADGVAVLAEAFAGGAVGLTAEGGVARVADGVEVERDVAVGPAQMRAVGVEREFLLSGPW